jgi:hypothetical protein
MNKKTLSILRPLALVCFMVSIAWYGLIAQAEKGTTLIGGNAFYQVDVDQPIEFIEFKTSVIAGWAVADRVFLGAEYDFGLVANDLKPGDTRVTKLGVRMAPGVFARYYYLYEPEQKFGLWAETGVARSLSFSTQREGFALFNIYHSSTDYTRSTRWRCAGGADYFLSRNVAFSTQLQGIFQKELTQVEFLVGLQVFLRPKAQDAKEKPKSRK